jgi:hypothetical protein
MLSINIYWCVCLWHLIAQIEGEKMDEQDEWREKWGIGKVRDFCWRVFVAHKITILLYFIKKAHKLWRGQSINILPITRPKKLSIKLLSAFLLENQSSDHRRHWMALNHSFFCIWWTSDMPFCLSQKNIIRLWLLLPTINNKEIAFLYSINCTSSILLFSLEKFWPQSRHRHTKGG